MREDINIVLLGGNLTIDPEKIKTDNGKDLCKFAIANTTGNKTQFVNVVCWGNVALNCCKYLSKGDSIIIKDGELNVRTYMSDKGIKKYITEVLAKQIQFIRTKKVGEQEEPQQPEVLNKIEDEDLPF